MLRLLAVIVGLVPWKALRIAGAPLGWLAGSVLRVRRRHVLEAMRAAGLSDAPRKATAMYRSLGVSAMEFLWLAGASRGAGARHVTIDPAAEPLWHEALARGRGVVIAASHTGNWDLAACALAGQIPLMVVTKRLSVKSLDRFWQSTRKSYGVSLAPADGALRRARAQLQQRGAVAMMIDQVPSSGRGAVQATFLGRTAFVDRAPAALAGRSGAPLVVAASRREASGEHTLHVLRVFDPPERAGREWVVAVTMAASEALDRFVRAQPDQWLWLHRRWRSPRVDPDARQAMLVAPCRIRSSSRASASQVA